MTRSDAKALLDLALNDPAPAVEEANRILASGDDLMRVAALRARGLARRQLGGFGESRQDLEQALSLAQNADEWAGVAITLAGTLVHLGLVRDAKEVLNSAIERSEGRTRAQAIYQLGTTHAQAGELEEAVICYERALPLIQEAGEIGWEANLLGNRGTMNIYRGRYDEAIGDLEAAIDLIRETSSGVAQLALYINNTAYAMHLRGDIAEAVERFQAAEQLQLDNGLPTTMFAHRCNAYLAAGMYEETLTLAHEAYRFHREDDGAVGAIEALLAGADAALALGSPAKAQELIQSVRRVDNQNSFPAWIARAEVIEVEAHLAERNATVADVEQCHLIRAATATNDSSTAMRALLAGAEISLGLGDRASAGALLEEARSSADTAPRFLEVHRYRLEAEFALDTFDDALRLVSAGLDAYVDLHQATPDYDMRVKAARHAAGLVDLVLPGLIERDDLETIVAMVEVTRATTMGAAIRAESVAGPTQPSQISLTFLVVGDRVLVVSMGAGEMQLSDCGSLAEVTELIDRQSFLHRQLARRERLEVSVSEDLLAAAKQVDLELGNRLLANDLGTEVVVNPGPELHAVSWGCLPQLRDRPFCVAASRGLANRPRPGMPDHMVVIGARELPYAVAEAEAVGEVWGVDPVLGPGASYFDAPMLGDLLHVACHFETDESSPLLSAMQFGPVRLTAHDFLALEHPPRVAVFSSCGSGHGAPVGTTTSGFVAAALAAGAATVVATSNLVEDGPGVSLVMRRLHEHLRAGVSPAEALADLRLKADAEDRSVIGSFVVYGSL